MKRLAGLLILAACAGRAPDPVAPPPPPDDSEPEPVQKPVETVTLRDVGIDPENLDRGANPCDDFYRFACGGWIDKAEIPADLPAWGKANELRRRNEQILRDILEDAARAPGDDPALQKLGAYHRACMDEAAVEKAGLTALTPLLRLAGKVRNVPTLGQAVAELHQHRVFVLFRIDHTHDYKDSSQVIADVSQAGLGLPDREYYLADAPEAKKLRDAYVQHVERMLRLLGHAPAAARRGATDVLEIETALARSQKSRVELRDLAATYNRLDRAGLVRAAPALGWDAYFRTLGRPDVTAVNVPAPAYLEAVDGMFTSVAPAAWRSYLAYHIGATLAPYLPARFTSEVHTLARLVTGQKEQPERWRRCVALADGDLAELLSAPFVARHFGPAAKTAVETMVEQVRSAFGRSLTASAWMDAATQEKAAHKLSRLEILIGYPEKWKTYDFEIDDHSLLGNHLAAARFETARRLEKIGKPVDRGEFLRPPHQVNAYYMPPLNQMVFLAGILQPPFYDPEASVAVNLGAMGMVVGHELTHGFDDRGSQFDADGNMSGWWPDEVRERFRERTRCVADAYSRYEVLPGLSVNGELTLGENIADIGGTKMAFRAYRALRRTAAAAQVADGFTEDQQFFLALGQAWCGKEREAFLRQAVTTDPHSPRRFRVNGTVSQLRDFARAFECTADATMAPAARCEVW